MPKQAKKDDLGLIDQQDFAFISQKSTALLLSSPKGARKLILIIFVFFIFAIYWAANAQIDEITKGDGKVISSKQLQKLQSLEGGIISDVLISSGDRISKDDVLLVIDDTKFKSNLEEIRKKLLILEAQKQSLSSELNDEPLIFSDDLSNELPVITKQEMDFFATRQKEKESIELIYKNQIEKLDNSFTEYTGKSENLRTSLELVKKELEEIRKKLLILDTQKESFSSELNDEPLVFSADLSNELPVITKQEMDFFATRQKEKESIELIYKNQIEKLDNSFTEYTGKSENLRTSLELVKKELEEIRKKLLILDTQKESFSSELNDEPLIFSADLSNELPVITKQEMDFFATRQKEKESIELTYKNRIEKLDNNFAEFSGKADNLRKNLKLAEEEIEIYRSLQDNNLVSKVELITLEKELNNIKGELFQSEIKAKQIETLKTEALNERDSSNLVIKNEIYKYLQNKDLVSKVELIALEKELNNIEGQLFEAEIKAKQIETLKTEALNERDSSNLVIKNEIYKYLQNKDLVSKVELITLEKEMNSIKGELFQSEIKAKQIETLKTEALNERNSSNLSMRNNAQEKLKSTLAEIEILKQSEIVALDRLNRTLIRSPVNGIVQRVLTSTISSVISPGEDLIEIVPIDDALLIEAKIRPIDIGFLSPGQDVIVKFSAYDYVIYGGLKGNLEYISADTVVDRDESYYLIKVRTDVNFIEMEKERLEIIPGMTASVNIITGKKTVLDYLLKPVLRAKHNSMHER